MQAGGGGCMGGMGGGRERDLDRGREEEVGEEMGGGGRERDLDRGREEEVGEEMGGGRGREVSDENNIIYIVL